MLCVPAQEHAGFRIANPRDVPACANLLHDLTARRHKRISKSYYACRRDLLDISPLVQDAAAAIVDDSFLRCFQSQSSDPWNWNIYLAPLWAVGVVVRHLILFPLR